MKNEIDLWGAVKGVVFIGIGYLIGVIIGVLVGYKTGQKDALLGKQKYEMKVLYEREWTGELRADPIPIPEGYVYDGTVMIMGTFRPVYDSIPVDTLIIKKK